MLQLVISVKTRANCSSTLPRKDTIFWGRAALHGAWSFLADAALDDLMAQMLCVH